MAWGFWFGAETKRMQALIDDALHRFVPGGLRWGLVGLITLGGPLISTPLCWSFAHNFTALSTLAEIDAVLIIAIVADARGTFALVGTGASRRTQMTLRLSFLWVVAFGLLIVADTALAVGTRDTVKPNLELVSRVALGYGFFALVAAVMLLAMSASARLLIADVDNGRVEAENTSRGVDEADN